MKRQIKILGLLLTVLSSSSAMAGQPNKAENTVNVKIDSESGLKIAPGWDTVKANCTACHSAKLISGQQGDKKTWLEMIRWMQNSQGLWPLDHKTEETILTYLSSQYPAVQVGRRANLPVKAMPVNPWAQK